MNVAVTSAMGIRGASNGGEAQNSYSEGVSHSKGYIPDPPPWPKRLRKNCVSNEIEYRMESSMR